LPRCWPLDPLCLCEEGPFTVGPPVVQGVDKAADTWGVWEPNSEGLLSGACGCCIIRDGSVVSFNIALNPSDEYEGGGTYFKGLDTGLRIEEGHIVMHASNILVGGKISQNYARHKRVPRQQSQSHLGIVECLRLALGSLPCRLSWRVTEPVFVIVDVGSMEATLSPRGSATFWWRSSSSKARTFFFATSAHRCHPPVEYDLTPTSFASHKLRCGGCILDRLPELRDAVCRPRLELLGKRVVVCVDYLSLSQ
jgi:hypothetical protein